MNITNYIRIFRGDDSDALGYQTIVGTIKTDIDLAGCKAVFRFLGFYAEFDPIPEDKKLTIVIPAQASRGFPPGVGYASLKVIDAYGKIRTFTNRIPVIVDTMTPSCSGGEFEISFSPFPNLEPLRIFMGPNADDFDQYTGFISKTIDRASLAKYGLVMLADAMGKDGGASGKAASPLAVKAAYDAIIATLTDNYYTASETEEAIDRVAAYYITYTAAGAAFPTYSALSNATTVYSGGKVRIPTRNDYCVVLADETHSGAEYRYIYAVAEGDTTGSWQPQFPVEGVMTVDQTVQKNSQNPVSGGGVWSMLWGALSALPTGFASLYDWCISTFFKASSVAIPFGSRRWLLGDLCSYNGVVYRCKTPYTSIGSSATPDADTAHWEVKRASELFLRLVGDNSVNGSVSAGYTVDNDGGFCAIGALDDGGYAEVGRTGITGYTRYRDGKIEYLAPGQADAQTINLPAKSGTVALDSDTTLTPVYSDTLTFSEWTLTPDDTYTFRIEWDIGEDVWVVKGQPEADDPVAYIPGTVTDTALSFTYNGIHFTATRTRTDIIGYQLGSQSDKPLQPKGDYPTKAQMDAGWWSEWELAGSLPFDAEIIPSTSSRPNPAYHPDPDHWQLEVLYNGDVKIGACSGSEDADRLEFEFNEESGLSAYTVIATRHRVAAPVPTKPEDIGAANRAANPTAGNLAALDAQGNPTDSGIAKTAVAPLASPAFTGTPTAPTPTVGDDSTKIATTAFVKAAVAGVTPNLDYVMRVDPETGGIYYTTPDTNA